MGEYVYVGPDLEAGLKLTEALDQSHFEAPASLWLYLPESAEWRLVVASPLVDAKGPSQAYAELQRIISRKHLALDLRQVSLVSPLDPLIKLLRSAVKTGRKLSRTPLRFTGNTINNVYIDDAFIYRVT